MNKIIASHLKKFVHDHGLDADHESVQFEKFVCYSILSPRIAVGLDLESIITGAGEDGTDGVALVINEELIVSADDATLTFSKDKRQNDVEIVFIQAKRSENFDLGDFLKFKDSVLRFLTAAPYVVENDVQAEANRAFNVVIDNVPKVRNGKPNISCVYACTGIYKKPGPLEVSRKEFSDQVDALGLFNNIDIRFLARDELIKAWVASYSGVEVSLSMQDSASLPPIAGVEESYLVVVRARDYVNNIITNQDGTIRGQIFEENVRHYLGSQNPVNAQIKETLENTDSNTRFPVLNNGITIVSPDVRVQATTLHLTNFQIVNGCQTSHVLFENRERLNEHVMVALKVVETTDEDVFSELVRATNSQSKIDETQFLSLSPMAKRVEAHFNAYEEQDEPRLYFERRDKQYVERGIPAIRIVSLHDAAKCVCAMFLRRPDLAFKYPKKMYEELGRRIFCEENRDEIFYASALTLYRFYLLRSNRVIPQNLGRFKWHMLALAAAVVSGKDVPALNSRRMESYCQGIIAVMGRHSDKSVEVFQKISRLIGDGKEVSDDRLKRQSILESLWGEVG